MAEPPHRVADPNAPTEAAPLAAARITSSDEAPPLVANRYEILGMLGSGGMGTVYRARDRELEEIVALKVLKKELAASSDMLERFRREVKLARRVTHKNVARTFDIGDHEGDRFLTMELVDGEMLGVHLARRGRVPIREVIAIARDVCAGLAAAHAAGVLHRDLKPENVIIARDGRAVITDFGIARAFAHAELGRTAAGGMVGTPAYMAPEQVEGVADLDARADLYALGTMLFELLTGKLAWPGESVVAIAAGRILRPPPDVRSIVPDIPEEVAGFVLKLMARDREHRHATAEEAGEALAALAAQDLPSTTSLAPKAEAAARGAHGQRKTVAVLPLLNVGDAADAYLAQTVTEDLVDLLSVVPALRLRPRGETARFDATTRDVRDAGRMLDVDVVVDGSLRRIGDVVRVSVRLITVEDGFQLWARGFDRAPSAVLSVADEAASAIARALATERTAEARPAPADPIAQDLYLRGRYVLQGGWFMPTDGMMLLREAHQRAPNDTRIAGTYALAAARVLTGEVDSFAAAADARELAERTLEADPNQTEARVALGFLHLNDGEAAAAAVQLKRALATSPNAIDALDTIGRILVEVGRVDLGLTTLRQALSIEPLFILSTYAIARTHALLGDMDSAREVIGPLPERLEAMPPNLMMRARLAMWRYDLAEAAALVRDVELHPELPAPVKQRVHALVAIVERREVELDLPAHLVTFDKRYTPRRISFHAQMRAEIRLAIGNVDGALDDLRIAEANGLIDLLWLDRCPLLDSLRARPEFLKVRESTLARAERVIRVLDPASSPTAS